MDKKTSWFTPYLLTLHNINKVVSGGKPGVYILGNVGSNKKLQIKHIRSSNNVKVELEKNVGKYQIFMYKPLKFQLGAFKQQQQMLQFA